MQATPAILAAVLPIVCLSSASSVSLGISKTATAPLRLLHKNFRFMDKTNAGNTSCADARIIPERLSVDAAHRRVDERVQAKIPIVSAFLSPLSASLSVFRRSMASISSGVAQCSNVIRKSADTTRNPMSFMPLWVFGRGTKSAQSAAAVEGNLPATPTKDVGRCKHHVVHRRISIDARCVQIAPSEPCSENRCN